MASYTTIDNLAQFFNTILYTGNSSTQSITGLGHQPDFVWIKDRLGATSVYSHHLFDSVRGATKYVLANEQDAEATVSTTLTSFDSDGFSLGSDASTNASGDPTVAWCWKAGGSSSSNSDGSVTSTVSANTTSGFSIAEFTGSGSNLTIGHGLGVKPDFIMLKCTSSSSTDWTCYHSSLGATKRIKLNVDDAASTNSTTWQDTEPTTSVISVGTSGDVNVSSGTHIVYSFANKQGAVKCGSFTGNGNDNGTFVHTGFRPAWTMIKCTSAADHWPIDDNKRSTSNLMQNTLRANLSNGEYTGSAYGIDFLSNGFKVRNDDGQYNLSGGTFVYMAFAESPFVNSNGVPNNAR